VVVEAVVVVVVEAVVVVEVGLRICSVTTVKNMAICQETAEIVEEGVVEEEDSKGQDLGHDLPEEKDLTPDLEADRQGGGADQLPDHQEKHQDLQIQREVDLVLTIATAAITVTRAALRRDVVRVPQRIS